MGGESRSGVETGGEGEGSKRVGGGGILKRREREEGEEGKGGSTTKNEEQRTRRAYVPVPNQARARKGLYVKTNGPKKT